ncbi:MAG: hypothetical protein ONB46_20300 [candidate division KSB1 bacterium]|nr:hypothetical protein [candidate division KSB1 bacterium]MDZ7368166.1 hypothetical protein [candidate division KSB1 bacterium]MDZ7405943.1 hypothetical protein [candidate division KSB1 bacterium]
MNYTDYAFGRFATDIAAVAQQYQLDLDGLEVELFTPGRQAIVVEAVGNQRFRIHINLEENRIIAVKQITPAPVKNLGEDPFAKYKKFMK